VVKGDAVKRGLCFLLVAVGFAGFATTDVQIRPMNPAALRVICDPGTVTLPDGRTVKTIRTQLSFDPPEIRMVKNTATAPSKIYGEWMEVWQPWPGHSGLSINIFTKTDDYGVPVLGGLFRAFRFETLKVTSAAGSKVFERDVDYKINTDWAQLAPLNREFSGELKISCDYALQRLDLIQVLPDGTVAVKKGESVQVCPELPKPDEGAAAVAGIYIAAWRAKNNPHLDGQKLPDGTAEYAITEHEIYLIDPKPPVPPVNPGAVSATLEKLKAGERVSIAFMGDSISTGAEAGHWWADQFTEKDQAFRGKVITGLRKRFPESKITPIEAYKGGATLEFGVKVFDETVKTAHADLVIIAFGANDADGSVDKAPRNPPEQFGEQMTSLVQRAKEQGMEVILVMESQINPWHPAGAAGRQPDYLKVLKEIADNEQVALVDVYTEWIQLPSRGIPPFSQLHNGYNHPGIFGHSVYASCLLRLFPIE
jgi:lysophospholipase L1-like esterase